MLPFSLPAPAGFDGPPHWDGHGFRLGGKHVPVLEYSENFAGWSDELTTLHEEASGDAHPIDVASRADAVEQLRSHLSGTRPTILEVGCSSGFMIKAMKQAFPDATIIGADVVKAPLYRLAEDVPTVPLLRFDLLKCPLPDAAVDAVVMLNVLEHIEDDFGAVQQARRILKPGGVLILEVPAVPDLYDTFDAALRHFRRYRASELSQMLQGAGFEIIRRSHLGFFLYPMFAYVKHRNRRGNIACADQPAFVRNQVSRTAGNRLVRWALAIEQQLAPWIDYPIGIRCLMTLRKRI